MSQVESTSVFQTKQFMRSYMVHTYIAIQRHVNKQYDESGGEYICFPDKTVHA